jgi:hypothetical protein
MMARASGARDLLPRTLDEDHVAGPQQHVLEIAGDLARCGAGAMNGHR